MNFKVFISFAVLACTLFQPSLHAKDILRIGFFPNLTHAQGVIGAYTDKTPELPSWFAERLGDDVELQWYCFNAGPSAMEALFAGSIDITYVGPNPSLNAYIRSKGKELRVLCGACRGGAVLLTHPDSHIQSIDDFRGKKIATPQLGNTQDIACRYWLQQHGLKITQTGGDAFVIPTRNPDQLNLFQQHKIDAVFTVEPWVSRLELIANAQPYYEQNDAIVTVLAAGAKALKNKKELIEKFKKAHKELTIWIIDHPEEAKDLVSKGIAAEVHRPLPTDIVENAWERLTFDNNASKEDFTAIAEAAKSVGFLKSLIPLDNMLLIEDEE